ncbi:MAG: peptide chain release factor 2 [Candidatus Doudnabacteria bacterium RIFCSPHIGHO2_01_FULL_49_9]|uniref:Peptide chain release factor 2 n=1 Tax=Candidatus Doudnabacteria bacterium RIFCSPHIGHO2_01_FULL_49_9 TaxID=1817827 RepID=A0A1F5P365_9BACT|nr:MAG: peptide chain release factor 2 [Candidatus Doudnabacteria bacterium RIFCSPHIGHO2_01_FULL_49_9]
MSQPDFWADNRKAQEVSKKLASLKNLVEFWEKLERDVVELQELAKITPTSPPPHEGEELDEIYEDLKKRYEETRISTFLSEKYDDHDAIVSIHAGAGGLDAQDWAEILQRMYLRFCERKRFKTQILDSSRNPEGGIKSATFETTGPFAYGYLKSEAGVHRLIRLSPFNPAHTRETSFALVEVLPVLEREEEVKLDPKELKIEAKTASGHGGQSVNTTYSAIRITHIPTGLTVSIQNERSQTQNKEQALKILTAKLKKLEEEKHIERKLELRGEFKSPEWSNQIRSYTMHPYKLVKDHRTNFETSNIDDVLDGKLDDFIEKYLESEK